MVAPLATLARWCAAELARPDHQGLIQQPATLQVGQEGRDRLVGLAAMAFVVLVDVTVGVPGLFAVTAARINLDEPDPTLDQPPCQQATPAESLGPRIVQAIEPLGIRRFAREVDRLGGTRLASERPARSWRFGPSTRSCPCPPLAQFQLGQEVELIALLSG